MRRHLTKKNMLLGVLILGLAVWMHFPLLTHKYDEFMYATTAKPLARPAVTIARPLADPRSRTFGYTQEQRRGLDRKFATAEAERTAQKMLTGGYRKQ